MNPTEYKEYQKRTQRIIDGIEEPDRWSIHDGVIMIQCLDPAMMEYVEKCTGIAFKNDIGESARSDVKIIMDGIVTITKYHNELRNWFVVRVNEEFIENIKQNDVMKVGTIDRNHELIVKNEDIQSVIDSWRLYHKKE